LPREIADDSSHARMLSESVRDTEFGYALFKSRRASL
jgi:hypothetical protein